jgi:hypothetical protein
MRRKIVSTKSVAKQRFSDTIIGVLFSKTSDFIENATKHSSSQEALFGYLTVGSSTKEGRTPESTRSMASGGRPEWRPATGARICNLLSQRRRTHARRCAV